MTLLAQMQNKVDQMISERDVEIKTLQENIQLEDSDIQKAKEAMTAASDASDLPSYQKSKKQLQGLTDAKEMHEARLKKLTDQPLISEQEYKEMISDLTSEMNKEVEDAKPRLKAASDQLAEIGNEVQADADMTDQLMKKIQSELYRNADRRKNDRGFFLDTPLTYKNHFDICEWASAGKKYYLYDKVAEGKDKA